MGTRHLIGVVSEGKVKVAQYGQWDGYLSGQGETVKDFILGMDFDAFKKNVDACHFMDQQEIKKVDATNDWTKVYPHLSRDNGAKILQMISEKPLALMDQWDFAADSLFCEFAYILDLDKKNLEIYKGFNTKPVPPGQRFSEMPKKKDEGEYYPVTLLKEIPFGEIKEDTMELLDEELSKEDED